MSRPFTPNISTMPLYIVLNQPLLSVGDKKCNIRSDWQLYWWIEHFNWMFFHWWASCRFHLVQVICAGVQPGCTCFLVLFSISLVFHLYLYEHGDLIFCRDALTSLMLILVFHLCFTHISLVFDQYEHDSPTPHTCQSTPRSAQIRNKRA